MGATKREGIVFRWEKPYGAADGQQCAQLATLVLWADELGQWRVVRKNGGGAPGSVLITQEDQVPGKNINEAKQRAQAAAIVQLQLTGEFIKHQN